MMLIVRTGKKGVLDLAFHDNIGGLFLADSRTEFSSCYRGYAFKHAIKEVLERRWTIRQVLDVELLATAHSKASVNSSSPATITISKWYQVLWLGSVKDEILLGCTLYLVRILTLPFAVELDRPLHHIQKRILRTLGSDINARD